MNDTSNKISVIVPIYGVEKYLDQCIASIIAQTYHNLEIILVDDGSKDNCASICDKWKKIDSRIIVIHKENGGLVSARKAGIIAATGKYVTYVDGDDWIEPDMYKEMMKYKADVVISGFTKDNGHKCFKTFNRIPPGVYEHSDLLAFKGQMICIDPFYTIGIYPNVWNKLFIREKLLKIQLQVDERISIGEDFVVTFPYLLECNRIIVTNDTSYHYRLNPNGMTGSRDKYYLEKSGYLLTYIYENLYNKYSCLDKQLELYAAHILLNGIGILLDLRTKISFKDKCHTLDIVLNSQGIFSLLSNAEISNIRKNQKDIINTALRKKYVKCFIAVHKELLSAKLSFIFQNDAHI